MNLLLDTHILLWFLEDNTRLHNHLKELICNPENQIYLSSVSFAEMAIKASIGKLIYPDDITEICTNQGMNQLPFNSRHALALRELPYIHSDPFDRMLIVQGIVDILSLVTQESIIGNYDLSVIM